MMALAWRLARRDLRGGWRGLRIVIACLALGVAAIATVGGLRQAIEGGIAAHATELLGGDLEIGGGAQPLPDALRQWLRARHARLSDVEQLRSMLVAASGERQLVELKAVDAAWPLLGAPVLTPAQKLTQALAGIVLAPILMERLALRPGDSVRLGNARLRVSGALTTEPDHAATPSIVGPRALIALATLPATGLIQPGSMVTHLLRVQWPAGSDPAAQLRALQAAFPHQGWRLRGTHDAVPGATRFIDQLSLFLSLVGLTSLLVGGIGVATGVRAWLDSRARSIAVLRCLGASGGMVFAITLIQVLLLSLVGVAIGVAVGAVLPWAALSIFHDLLPVPPQLGVYPAPLALAALYGLMTAAAFALAPVGRALRIPGAALFRDALLPTAARPPLLLLVADAVLIAALIGLTVATAPSWRLAAGFCAAAIATLALFRAGAFLLMRAARAWPVRRSATWRLGLGNLYRPGSATPLMLVAVGLGLSTLAAVALTEGNMAAQLESQLPSRAPAFFFIDIQPDQLDRFAGLVHASAGATFETVPNLISRVAAVNGVPVERLHPTEETAWVMRGDRNLTYAATPPAGTRIMAGQWWAPDYAGPALVSLDDTVARGWGLHLGDTITVTVLGRPIDLKLANTRRIDWRSLSINYAMVTSPSPLDGAPHANIATVRMPPGQQGQLLRAITDALPNVTGIAVADVLAAIGTILRQIGAALAATGSLTLASGALVLAGAVAAGQRRRIQQAVILKSLGATRGQIRTAWLVEFGLLGVAAGVIAAAVGAGASWAIMHYVMKAEWVLLPGRLAATIAACVGLMLAFGYLGTASALRAKVAPLLRTD